MPELITAAELLKQVERETQPSEVKKRKSTINPHRKALGLLVRKVKRYADDVQLKVAITTGNVFVPHLRIVVEPAQYKGITMPLQGPWLFDLTMKPVPLSDFSAHWSWRTMVDGSFLLDPPKADIKQAFERSLTESIRTLKQPFFESTILSRIDVDQDEIINANYQYLLKMARTSNRLLDDEHMKMRKPVLDEIAAERRKAASSKTHLRKFKTRKFLRETFTKDQVMMSAETRQNERVIAKCDREIAKRKKVLSKMTKECTIQKQAMIDNAFAEAHKRIKKVKYEPMMKDLLVHATILLVPKRKVRK